MFRILKPLAMAASILIPQLLVPSTFAQDAPVLDTESTKFSFVVIGDIPYSDQESKLLLGKRDDATTGLVRRIQKSSDFPFVIHIGDFVKGSKKCTDGDKEFQTLIDDLDPKPIFYTPGDNEWTDCDRKKNESGKRFSELDRLKNIRSEFIGPNSRVNSAGVKQKDYPENVTWKHGDVRFVTLHVTGTNNGWSNVKRAKDRTDKDDERRQKRDLATLQWLGKAFDTAKADNAKAVVIAMHADMSDLDRETQQKDRICKESEEKGPYCDAFTLFRTMIEVETKNFENGHVLLIHGDTSPFTLNQRLWDNDYPPMASNFWRLNAAGDFTSDVTIVTYHPENNKRPFSARGLSKSKCIPNDSGAPAKECSR